MKAFTLTEVLIVLAIILIVSAASLPLIGNWSFSARTDGARVELVQMLRLTRDRSLAEYNHSLHGLKLMTDGYVLFQGADYASRQAEADLKIELDRGLVLGWQLIGSGQADEIVFASDNGQPNRAGRITITIGDTLSEINLNQAGYVD